MGPLLGGGLFIVFCPRPCRAGPFRDRSRCAINLTVDRRYSPRGVAKRHVQVARLIQTLAWRVSPEAVNASEEFLGQRDDDAGRASHVAKPVLVLVLDHLA